VEVLQLATERGQQLQKLQKEFQRAVTKASGDERVTLALEFASAMEEPAGAQLAHLKEAAALTGRLQQDESRKEAAIRPEDFAKRFRSLIDSIQVEARTGVAGEVATTLKSLDVELKGLIVVEKDEARLVTPSPTEPVDPGQLSTIRMSFGSIPVLPSPPLEQPSGVRKRSGKRP
jgi:hypothetical protein